MVWLASLLAIGFLVAGVDILILSARRSPMSDRDIDELVAGKGPPLSQFARDYARRNPVVQALDDPHVLAGIFIAIALALGYIALQLWLSPT